MKRSLPYKIAYVIPVLIIFATVLLFGRSYWPPLFDVQQPTQSVTQPIIEIKAKDPAPEVRHEMTADHTPVNPDPGNMGVEPEAPAPNVPSRPPAITSHSSTEIRVKEIVEVKEGATLYSIAYQYYKIADETFLGHILKLNPEIKNPNLIFVGQKIKIPEMTASLMIVKTPEGPYQVHLRTFRNQKIAEQYRQNVASMGKTIEVVPLKVSPEETWYRVMAEPFVSKDDGLKFIAEMKQKGFPIIP